MLISQDAEPASYLEKDDRIVIPLSESDKHSTICEKHCKNKERMKERRGKGKDYKLKDS